MALLDFTDILEDEDLNDTFTVLRRESAVDEETGRPSTQEFPYQDIIGVVVPGDPGRLQRRDDQTSQGRTITVTTKFRLRGAGGEFQPDIIVYDRVKFTVTAVKPWNRLGSGFYKAVATSPAAFNPQPL